MIHEKNKGSKAKLRLKHSNKKMHRNMPFVGNGPPFSCPNEDFVDNGPPFSCLNKDLNKM